MSVDIATNLNFVGKDLVLFSDESTGLETKAFNILKMREGDDIYYPFLGLPDIYDLFSKGIASADILASYLVSFLKSNEIIVDMINVVVDDLGNFTIQITIKGVLYVI